jgi:uncharacterized protein YjiS (DUF1127 family)
MTDLCNSPSDDCDRKGKADVPAVAVMPPARPLLWAFAAWLTKLRGRRRLGQLHRLNDYLLWDIGLSAREDDPEVSRRFVARREVEME